MEEIVKGSDENDWIIRKEKDIQNCGDEIWQCRRRVDEFLDRCTEEIPWSSYRIVGFSSMFHQQTASLSLAKRLKARFPDLYIVFGGVNCHGEMADVLLRNFSFIDAVCTGEGDKVFPEFAKAVLAGDISAAFPGMLQQNGVAPHPLAFLSSTELDELPYPDYDEFFEQRSRHESLADEQLYLMMESSRGCWWGAKSHCTFCGLDDLTLHYRRKNPDRMLAEIVWLTEKYGEFTRELFASDTIMPMEHFNALLPNLRDLGFDVGIFYEIQANLKKHHVQLCKESGVDRIQPGIESFSTKLLAMMKKGVTALQNIQLLKW